ncbi:MAG: hypothetical protein KBB32_11650 [Spirochaetia bacterium]|nr:hypothetical protein [Spirochaetia bacterium]
MIPPSPATAPMADLAYDDFDVVVRSGVTLDRNLSDRPFPWMMSHDQAPDSLDKLRSAAEFIGMRAYRAGELGQDGRAALAERDMYARSFLIDDDSVLAISPSEAVWLALNEREHCSIRSALPGLSLQDAWTLASRTDDLLGARATWAFDPDAGYLCTDAERCGTGLSAQVSLHLPALTMAGYAEAAFRRAMESGFVVTGAYASTGPSAGALYGLALPAVYREPEALALERLSKAAKALAEYERRARADLATRAARELVDAVGRAAGVAAGARLVSRDEAADLVSNLRLGLCAGVLEGASLRDVTELWVAIRIERGGPDISDSAARARLLRTLAGRMRITKGYLDV